MSKAVVVIDIPNSCSTCKIVLPGIDGYYCPFEPILIANRSAMSKRMDWCPLRPLPEKKKTRDAIQYRGLAEEYRKEGWNECLEEITGEKE